jgi:hypothetical protein
MGQYGLMFEAIPNNDPSTIKNFSISLFIDPNGLIYPQSSYDKHIIKPFKNYCATFP